MSPLDDHGPRLVLLAGLLIILPTAAYHRVRSATGEKLDRRQEGLFILITLRPIAAAHMIGLLAYITNPRWMTWSWVPLPAWLRWTGVGLGVVAGGLLTWTLRSLGKNLTDTVVTRRDHVLVRDGPYRWVRHPFYCSVALALLANSLVAANWFLFVTGVLLVALFVIRTRKEEENLLARFGDEYRTYMKQTGGFLPRIKGVGGTRIGFL